VACASLGPAGLASYGHIVLYVPHLARDGGACEESPCGERRGIAGGATTHLLLSSTLEPLSALGECTHLTQDLVLRVQP